MANVWRDKRSRVFVYKEFLVKHCILELTQASLKLTGLKQATLWLQAKSIRNYVVLDSFCGVVEIVACLWRNHKTHSFIHSFVAMQTLDLNPISTWACSIQVCLCLYLCLCALAYMSSELCALTRLLAGCGFNQPHTLTVYAKHCSSLRRTCIAGKPANYYLYLQIAILNE